MSITRTKRRFRALRVSLEQVSDALEVLEAHTVAQRDRLLLEIDALLGLLAGMLEVHGDDARLAREIRERIDSTLDERNRLMGMGDR